MQPIFNIQHENRDSTLTSLYGEVSNEGLSYFFMDEGDKKITGLTVFHFPKNSEINTSNILKKIFDEQPLLKNNFEKIFFSYAFNECILTPELYYNPYQNEENINLIYGDLNKGIIFSDHVGEKNIYSVYKVPSGIHETVLKQFPAINFMHQYSLLVKQLPDDGNILKVIFYQNRIVITLLKHGQLQIMQTFNYITAEDVVYHLLNICKQFEVEDAHLQLAGMIENDSALYKEIHKYFLNINFTGLPPGLLFASGIKELPNHFFSHLFSFAVCV